MILTLHVTDPTHQRVLGVIDVVTISAPVVLVDPFYSRSLSYKMDMNQFCEFCAWSYPSISSALSAGLVSGTTIRFPENCLTAYVA